MMDLSFVSGDPTPSSKAGSTLEQAGSSDAAPSERVELTEAEREALLCACGGEDPTFCLAHGSPPHADPSYQSLDLSGEDLVGRVESIIAARLAQVEAERDRLSALIRDQLGHCICTPYPMGDGPQEDCGIHGREYGWWVEGFHTVQQRNIDLSSERDVADARVNALAEKVAAVEALAEKWRQGEFGWGPWQIGDLRAALTNPGETLARVRAEAGAKALEDAAVRASAELGWEKGGHTSTYSVRKWLRERAAGLPAPCGGGGSD